MYACLLFDANVSLTSDKLHGLVKTYFTGLQTNTVYLKLDDVHYVYVITIINTCTLIHAHIHAHNT